MRPLLLVLLLASCVTEELEEVNEATVENELQSANKLAANKLAANKLAANKLAANKLAANSLASLELMATPDGREVMSYIVGCALPTGTSVRLSDPAGLTYSYAGWIGLAPSWATTVPTVSQRRWVSACVLARTNLYGISVQISMRNLNNPVLATTTTETTTFNVGEAAFYGDLFAPVPVMYACANKRFATTPDLAVESFRACARSANGITTECGFTFTGYCGTAYTDGRPAACRSSSGSFVPCSGGATSYPETITIYLVKPAA